MSVSTFESTAVRVAAANPTVAGPAALAAPVARAMLAALFLLSAPGHFSAGMIGYAASTGLPFANLLVPASGVLALLGGLSVLLGYRARLGGVLLALFLVPVTLQMHAFWTVTDPGAAQIQFIMFMKNVGLLGGALLVTSLGAGPLSLDALAAARRFARSGS